MNLQDLRSLLDTGVGLGMATRDSNMIPDMTDPMGILLSEDGEFITVYIGENESRKALENIKDNGQIAVSFCRPCNYVASQIKAHVEEVRPMTPQEKAKAQEWGNKYRDEIKLIGFSAEAAENLIFSPDMAVRARVTGMFIQTPGPTAGQRMEPT